MTKVRTSIGVVSAGMAAVAAAYIFSKRLQRRSNWSRTKAILEEFRRDCSPSISPLRQVVDAMTVEVHAGLDSEGDSKLKMLLSFVDNLPSGTWFYVETLGRPCHPNEVKNMAYRMEQGN